MGVVLHLRDLAGVDEDKRKKFWILYLIIIIYFVSKFY